MRRATRLGALLGATTAFGCVDHGLRVGQTEGASDASDAGVIDGDTWACLGTAPAAPGGIEATLQFEVSDATNRRPRTDATLRARARALTRRRASSLTVAFQTEAALYARVGCFTQGSCSPWQSPCAPPAGAGEGRAAQRPRPRSDAFLSAMPVAGAQGARQAPRHPLFFIAHS